MYREHVCFKKDKRLLVLLALGVLVIFSDIVMGAMHGSKAGLRDTAWLELQSAESKLIRLDLTDQPFCTSSSNLVVNDTEIIPMTIGKEMLTGLEQGRAIALEYLQGGHIKQVPASPKLSFFLGAPFSVNKADTNDLTLIHGVGPALAAKIIAYRHENGPITSATQLQEVHGIGPKMTKKIQNFIIFTHDGK